MKAAKLTVAWKTWSTLQPNCTPGEQLAGPASIASCALPSFTSAGQTSLAVISAGPFEPLVTQGTLVVVLVHCHHSHLQARQVLLVSLQVLSSLFDILS